MDNLSIIIPSYNNLRHLKNCYHSLRRWYPELQLILLDDGSDDGTLEWMGEIAQDDDNVILQHFEKRHGHTILYDAGVSLSNKDVVGILHADMIVTKNTFENMLKHLEKGKVVCATRIEPPLHPAGEEKIIKDFGQDFDTLDIPAFEQFAERRMKEYEGETTNGMFAPWIIHRDDYENMLGHDHVFAPFPYEDSDIFQRWVLEDYDLIQSRDAFVYHLTCRGHRWNEEIGKNDEEYKGFEERARRNFIRKWGSWIQNDSTQHPIVFPKYDIGFVVHNCSKGQFYNLEPWCSDIYIEDKSIIGSDENRRNIEALILDDKTHDISEEPDNDVVVEFDAEKLTVEMFNQFITNIQRIVDEMAEPNQTYKWYIFTISVKDKESFGKEHFEPVYKTEMEEIV